MKKVQLILTNKLDHRQIRGKVYGEDHAKRLCEKNHGEWIYSMRPMNESS